MKKLIFLLIFVFAFTPPAFAAEAETAEPAAQIETGIYRHPTGLDEADAAAVLPQPYENICQLLSNGKDNILKALKTAASRYISGPDYDILAAIGREAAPIYKGDPSLGMAKFCLNCLELYGSAEEQAKALSAFLAGYGYYGAVLMPFAGYEKEPAAKTQIWTGKFAWIIPFKYGYGFKMTLLGKKEETAKIWKILPGNTIVREWAGGFWEREITVTGK